MSEDTAKAPRKIAPPWLADPGIQAVLDALGADGAEARFVGGCVRNALLGDAAPTGTDIDIAIDQPPQETIRLLGQAGLKAIPTGVEHGTVTTLTPKEGGDGGVPVEVTSLRRDVETDGRRAVVAFTSDWVEDAMRRDFTMNALYAGGDGVVFDPLGSGVADLEARRLRFIGAAEARIREDYLRILRYFRFFAWYGAAGGLDPEDLAATARLSAGLEGLARERVGAELRKLFASPSPAAAVRAMYEAGVLKRVLPHAAGSAETVASRLQRLERAEYAASAAPGWIRRLAAVIGDGLGGDLDPAALSTQLRLSKQETAALKALRSAVSVSLAEAAYRWGGAAAFDAAALRAAREDALISKETLAEIETGAAARMPIGAQDLINAGVPPGPGLGAALKAAERDWIAQGFDSDPAALLARVIGGEENL